MSKPDEYYENRKQTHELKTWPMFWSEVANGNKSFEFRKNDRDFCLGDKVILKEFDDKEKKYTGSELDFTITYVLNVGKFVPEAAQYCVLGFKELSRLHRSILK